MRTIGLLVVVAILSPNAANGGGKVSLLKTPHGGIQPQALVDDKGTLHLIYFKGEPGAGDLFYVRREAGKKEFSTPLRVNSQAGSAIAAGTIRGGQMALGKGGRIHVAWNGSGKVKSKTGMPMLYSRLNDAGTAFEDERDLMTITSVLDGGGTVAADSMGNVYVAWHGMETGVGKGEEERRVWLARSSDDGKTFAKETPAWMKPTGACGCCGMRAFADSKGAVTMLYRSATAHVNRDVYLLSSDAKGARFDGVLLHRWKIAACPMSSMTLGEGPEGIVAAWDTDGQVYFSKIKRGTTEFSDPQAVPGTGMARKHPALAFGPGGEMILAYTEGTGWNKGGSLAWQVFDKSGAPAAEKGRLDRGIPVWGLPAVVAGGDGFVIIH